MEMKNRDIVAPYTTWKDQTPGGVVRSTGNAEEYKTGGWRAEKPVMNWEKCTQCLLCWPTCPDSAIPVEGKERKDFDYDHCKGCGVCKAACPFGAIEMKIEEK